MKWFILVGVWVIGMAAGVALLMAVSQEHRRDPKPVAVAQVDAGVTATAPAPAKPPLCLMVACTWQVHDGGVTSAVSCPKGFSSRRLELGNVVGCACCEGGK